VAGQEFDLRISIEKAIAAFERAANAKDAATMSSLYADDATLLPPGSGPIKGRSNIQAFWQAFLNAGASDPKLKIVELGSAGDIAYEIGSFEANMPNAQGKTAPTTGKYLVIWKRQQDGSIKMIADMFSSNT
jgi:uncharacterized protein (TIGR02246 family)